MSGRDGSRQAPRSPSPGAASGAGITPADTAAIVAGSTAASTLDTEVAYYTKLASQYLWPLIHPLDGVEFPRYICPPSARSEGATTITMFDYDYQVMIWRRKAHDLGYKGPPPSWDNLS